MELDASIHLPAVSCFLPSSQPASTDYGCCKGTVLHCVLSFRKAGEQNTEILELLELSTLNMFLLSVLCSLLQQEVSCVLPPKLEKTSCFCLPSLPWRLMSICYCILLLGYFFPFICFVSEFVV